MLDQTFTKKTVRGLVRKRDFIKYKLVKKGNKYLEDVGKVCDAVNSGSKFDPGFKETAINGKTVYYATSFYNTLVLRKLNDNIKRLYKVKQADRTNTVKQVICVLEDKVPMWVTKLDIKDFYESIDREALLKKMCTDSLLSYQSKRLLTELFQCPELQDKPGLPRGLSISATLSEIYMRDLDRYIATISGVYYYSRYVDDIIIFSYENSNDILKLVSEFLLHNLKVQLNTEKTVPLKVNCKCNDLCKCAQPKSCHVGSIKLICECNKRSDGILFDYLGYSFKITKSSNAKIPGQPVISLAEKKVKKYKKRIILSFRDYIKKSNYGLLEKRIQFLTGNCYPDPTNKGKKLKTGVYYNYQLINETEALARLDSFFSKALFSKKGSLGTKLATTLTKHQKEELKKYTFISGHRNKIFYPFSRSDLSQIRGAWQE